MDSCQSVCQAGARVRVLVVAAVALVALLAAGASGTKEGVGVGVVIRGAAAGAGLAGTRALRRRPRREAGACTLKPCHTSCDGGCNSNCAQQDDDRFRWRRSHAPDPDDDDDDRSCDKGCDKGCDEDCDGCTKQTTTPPTPTCPVGRYYAKPASTYAASTDPCVACKPRKGCGYNSYQGPLCPGTNNKYA